MRLTPLPAVLLALACTDGDKDTDATVAPMVPPDTGLTPPMPYTPTGDTGATASLSPPPAGVPIRSKGKA